MTKAASPVESIVQLVIDLPQLQAFLHPELADRKPLVLIESKEVSPDLSLKKFGQPVSIVQLNAAKGKPYLQLTELQVTGSKAKVRLDYPVEGVGGEAELEEKNGVWSVVKSEIWER